MKQVKADRLEYRKLGRDKPDDYTVVIIDGMDQEKTCLPNFNSGETLAELNVRVIGALVHGPLKRGYAYLIIHYTKETNTVLEVFLFSLGGRSNVLVLCAIFKNDSCSHH